ncbi:MAG: alpha/beta hydrolase, partial [Christensenellales bacterium]
MKKPVFVYIHGGGYISGTKELRAQYCFAYSEKGFFSLNIHYQYAPEAVHPVQIRQAFKAIEYVFDRAEEYNLDTDRVVLAGESAGAYFAAFISAITVNRELYDKLGIDFKYRDSFRVGSAVLLNGAYNIQNMFDTKFANMMTFMCAYTGKSRKQMAELKGGEYLDSISPVNYINADFPPCVVITGKLDPLLSEGVL